MAAKKKVLAILSEDEAKRLEAGRRLLDGSKRAVLISGDARKWQEWNIELASSTFQAIFRCKACGATWQPELLENGKLPAGYWHCPTGCNAEAK